MSIIEGNNKNKDGQLRKTKEYPEDFGKESEVIIARALKRRFSPLIKETEAATLHEDQREATDIWVDFGEAGVVAVQLTFSDSPEKMKAKRAQIKRKQFAKKEDRSDAVIKYNKNAHLVLAEYDKGDIAKAYAEYMETASQGDEKMPEDFVQDRTLMHIMGQIINELPAQAKVIVASQMAKIKKAGTKFRA
jgi:hypothetical protein